MSTRMMYGVGYAPIGDLGDDLEGFELLDLVDPLGIRKVPAKVGQKVDSFIDKKAARAATVASTKVEAGVRRVMNDATTSASEKVEAGVRRALSDAGSSAMMYAAGTLLLGLTAAGGIYIYSRSRSHGGGR